MITAVPRLFEMFHRAIVSRSIAALPPHLLAFWRVVHFSRCAA
jgi:hypothetical protein